MALFWLVILGLLTYIILRQRVPLLSGARFGVVWLVMMSPSIVLTLWELLHQSDPQQIPLVMILGPFFLSLSTCVFLLSRWRVSPEKMEASSAMMPSDREENTDGTNLPKPDFLSNKPPLNTEEEFELRRCFSLSTYFLHKVEYRLQAVICQGQLRATPDAAYAAIDEKVKGVFGDRFLLLLQEDMTGKPFFALVPNPHRRRATAAAQTRVETLPYRYGLALSLLLLTLLTTTLVGMGMAGFPVESFEAIAQQPHLLPKGLPYALSLLLILGVHEGGHFWAACHYKLKTSLPYFIPVPSFLGTFGAFVQIRSPMPDRKTLFDVGIAGPLAGLVVTLPLLVWGMAHSQVVPSEAEGGLMNFSALNPRYSVVLLLLGRLLFGSDLTSNGALALHPVAIAGYLGLVVTALNLMPIGQLDGGHVVHAMFGQKNGAIIGQVARLLVLLLAWKQRELLLWAVLLFFIPAVDEPALNDVSELDNGRDALGLLALAILLLIILPVPPVLANLIL